MSHQSPTSSDLLTATATIFDGSGNTPVGGYLHSVILSGGSAASSVIIYDNTSAAGTVLCKLKCVATDSKVFVAESPIEFKTGLHAVLAGTGGEAIVYYSLG